MGATAMNNLLPAICRIVIALGLLAAARAFGQTQPAPGGQWDEARVKKFDQAAKAAAEQTQANLVRQREKDRPVIEQQQRINQEQERKRQEMADAYWKAKAVQNHLELEAARSLSKWKEAERQGNTGAADQARAE